MTDAQRRLLEESGGCDRPLNRAIAAALGEIDRRTTGPAMKLPRPRESAVQKRALAYLHSRGIIAHRRNVVAFPVVHEGRRRFVRAGKPGQSDIWGLMPAPPGAVSPWWRHLEIEVKRPRERPTLEQVLWLTAVNDLTGAAFWFDDLKILESVVDCLMAGGRVVYLETTRRYGGITGPSGDYDLAP